MMTMFPALSPFSLAIAYTPVAAAPTGRGATRGDV